MTIFGPMVSRGDVEAAIIGTLQLWLPAYLDEFEDQHNLSFGDIPRPGPVSIVGGVDPETFKQENLPGVVVNCKPVDSTEIAGDGTITQWYEATLVSLVMGDDEASARALSDAYGAAVFTAISQRGSLGGFAIDTRPERAADAGFIDPDKRRIMHADCVFRTLVAVANRRKGPRTVPADGVEPPDDPIAVLVTTTVTAEP